jgi:hypothetical protein
VYFSKAAVNLLGYTIHNGIVQTDADHLQPVLDLPPPSDSKSQKHALGLFFHYSQWICNFSAKVQPLVQAAEFPLNNAAIESFNSLKQDVLKSVVAAINEKLPFSVETEVSDYAIGANLTQNNRPAVFFSRSLNDSERRHSSVEKEVYAIVEALRKWRHYLIDTYFTLVTDQRFVAFMFDNKAYCKK